MRLEMACPSLAGNIPTRSAICNTFFDIPDYNSDLRDFISRVGYWVYGLLGCIVFSALISELFSDVASDNLSIL